MKYSVKAAAHATGITESRLRTWERRYGIPHPGRSITGRRMYGEDDLEIIRRMGALVAAGVPASEAAEAARVEGEIIPPAKGHVEEEHPLVETILQAAIRYDEEQVVQSLGDAVSGLSWHVAIDGVVFPTLTRVGQYWGENRLVSANEHFLTEIVRRELCHAITRTALPGIESPTVLLACPEDERHDVGLLSLNLLLRQLGVRVYYLGADVPQRDLVLAMQQVQPGGVCLAATLQSGRAALTRAAREIVRSRLSAKVFIGGPAFQQSVWSSDQAPGIRLPDRIGEAADLIARTLKKEEAT
ncbi:MAG: MerR family transcriptional regulator [Chloroflexota bacterium]